MLFHVGYRLNLYVSVGIKNDSCCLSWYRMKDIVPLLDRVYYVTRPGKLATDIRRRRSLPIISDAVFRWRTSRRINPRRSIALHRRISDLCPSRFSIKTSETDYFRNSMTISI